MDGRRVLVKLEDEHIRTARLLGGGKIAAGVREALRRAGNRG